MTTYRVICPDCGAHILLNVAGDLYAGCPECAFYGYVPPLTQQGAETDEVTEAGIAAANGPTREG